MSFSARDIAQVMSLADDISKEVRGMAATNRKYSGLAEGTANLAEAIREWGLQELRNIAKDPDAIDNDPIQEAKHELDPALIGRGPGLPELDDEWKQFITEQNRPVVRDSVALTLSRQQDEYARQAQIGKDIAARFNPHYKNHH